MNNKACFAYSIRFSASASVLFYGFSGSFHWVEAEFFACIPALEIPTVRDFGEATSFGFTVF